MFIWYYHPLVSKRPKSAPRRKFIVVFVSITVVPNRAEIGHFCCSIPTSDTLLRALIFAQIVPDDAVGSRVLPAGTGGGDACMPWPPCRRAEHAVNAIFATPGLVRRSSLRLLFFNFRRARANLLPPAAYIEDPPHLPKPPRTNTTTTTLPHHRHTTPFSNPQVPAFQSLPPPHHAT